MSKRAKEGPLFVGEPAPIDGVQDDELWRLLAAGKATVEDQRYAAGWIATLHAPTEDD